jgi:hypothetical protein
MQRLYYFVWSPDPHAWQYTVKLAILIAVEKFSDPTIPSIPFASDNAMALAAALEPHGFIADDCIALTNELATKAAIESRVRRAIKSCLDDDVLYIYIASHMVSNRCIDCLTCFDTDSSDVGHTAIELSWLLNQLRACDSKQIVLFLDSGEDRLVNTQDSGLECDRRIQEQLTEFFESKPSCVCFAARQPDQVSHVSRKWKQGIWMHHIIEAFSGQTKLALTQGSLLTVRSLQDYLVRSVPQTIAKHYSSKSLQTPALYGSNETAILVDFEKLFASNLDAINPYSDLIRNISFMSERSSSVKSLTGFKKGNAIPDRATIGAQTFIAQIAREQISDDLKEYFTALKSAFKFKRADICVTDENDGTGTIITPYFNYSVSVQQDAENPSQVIWHRHVDAIKEPEQVFSPRFATVFERVFDTVEFTMTLEIDLGALIDSIETLDDDRIAIEYDPNATHCELSIDGVVGEIHLTKRSMRIVHPNADAPPNLLRSFLAIQSAILGNGGVSMIPLDVKQRKPNARQ